MSDNRFLTSEESGADRDRQIGDLVDGIKQFADKIAEADKLLPQWRDVDAILERLD